MCHAITIIYDNITTSNLKVLKIDDVANIKYLNDYPYEVYIKFMMLEKYEKNMEVKI